MQRLMAWLIFPITAIAAAVLLGLSTTQVVFSRESSFGATGGFGPNQVSAILGLGGLFALLMSSDFRLDVRFRVAFLVLALWFAAHSALSFSRTGLYLLSGGLLTALPFLALKHLLRPKNIAIACIAVLAGIAIWGFMVRYTGGMISQRFAETQMSNRGNIANQDMEIWKQHPLFGIGIGLSSVARSGVDGDRVASHTEYTRLLSEHGLFGLFAGVLLLSMWVRPLKAKLPAFTKAAVMACLTWALLSLAVSAMRTAAPAFLLGLAFARPVLYRRGVTTSGKRVVLTSSLKASVRGSAAPLTVGFQSVNSLASLMSPPSSMRRQYPGP
jgi:O-antigen ligase